MVLGYLWIGICVLSCVFMLTLKKNIFIASALSTVLPFILDLTVGAIGWQIASFFASLLILSLVMTFLFRKEASTGVKIDSLIGRRCIVEEQINNTAGRGQVRVMDTSWSARSMSDDEVYEVGASLKIVAVEGVKLICKN